MRAFNYDAFTKAQLVDGIRKLSASQQKALQQALTNIGDLLDQCDREFQRAIDAQHTILTIMRPYKGLPLAAVPRAVIEDAAKLEVIRDKAWKEYRRLDALIDQLEEEGGV